MTTDTKKLREERDRMREALKKIAAGKYGVCPVGDGWGPEKACTLCGDFGWFSDDPQYDPNKDGHCVDGGAASVARAALGETK